ncbi:MAG: dihydrolipoamide acetyltransferase family protein [Mycobacteriales bacterium]
MANLRQFRLPDLGEGLTEGEILKWLVAPGDQVALNQPIVEVETAKAAVEVPSPFAGVVKELHHGEGDTVDVGTAIITFDVEPSVAAQADLVPDIPAPGEGEAVEPGLIGGPAPGGRTSVLVGYGPRDGGARRRPRRSQSGAGSVLPGSAPPGSVPAGSVSPGSVPAGSVPAGSVPPGSVPAGSVPAGSVPAGSVPAGSVPAGSVPPGSVPARVSAAEVGRLAASRAGAVSVLAKPPVRKLARDLGVDLGSLTGTGPAGSISREDVQAAAAQQGASPPQAVAGERIAIRGVRRATAAAMVASAFTAPHVTEFITVDVTESMQLLQRLRNREEFAGKKLSPLLIAARALLIAVKRHPLINSSWDEAAGEILVHPTVNLGIAAATPRGLLVPNVKDAQRLSLAELADALADLASAARAGRSQPVDMQHGTITITNVGVFGVDTGTPILNPGEAAILCLGAIRPTPWVHEGAIAIRQVTQLGLSFDHRIVDGQLGSEVLADIAEIMADPSLMAIWG